MVVLPIVFFGSNDYKTLYLSVPLIGLFLNGIFGVFAVWFPEMYPTHLRATGASFCFNVGRIVSALGPFIGGSLVALFGGIPRAACVMGASYIVGLVAVAFASETKGKPLPE
jgi:MFS family permease